MLVSCSIPGEKSIENIGNIDNNELILEFQNQNTNFQQNIKF